MMPIDHTKHISVIYVVVIYTYYLNFTQAKHWWLIVTLTQ